MYSIVASCQLKGWVITYNRTTSVLTFAWASQGPTLTGKNEEKAQVLTEKIEELVVQV